jgi:DNA mismatch endonuclease (patch repair protein)
MARWPGNAETQRTTFGKLNRADLMARVRSRGNKTTEQRLVGVLRREKITGWRRKNSLPGHPDFVFAEIKLAIFVDGCFWHGHTCKRNLTPKRNASLWRRKIVGNKQRDARVNRNLRANGWRVLRIWECELQQKPTVCISRIEKALVARSYSQK